MKAIILVAGRGKRLAELTVDRPKPLIEVNSSPIIIKTLDNLIEYGIDDVILVTGYLKECFTKKIGTSYKGASIKYVENPIWDQTNNVYSLLLAMAEVEENEPFVLVEGDEFFDSTIINKNIFHDDASYWVGKRSSDICGCILFENNGLISDLEIIRDPILLKEKCKGRDSFKSCGIIKVGAELSEFIHRQMPIYCQNKTNVNNYFDLFIQENLSKLKIKVYPILNDLWYEIDDKADLQVAEKKFFNI